MESRSNRWVFAGMVLLLLSTCRQDLTEPLPPPGADRPVYLSIHDEPGLQLLKDELDSKVPLFINGRALSDGNIVDAADWTRVRMIEDEHYGHTAYGMTVDLLEPNYLDNLLVIEKEETLYPYVLSFTPSEGWKSDATFRSDHPLDGQVTLTSLSTGRVYENQAGTAIEGGRIAECTYVTTVWVETWEESFAVIGGVPTVIAEQSWIAVDIYDCNSGGGGATEPWDIGEPGGGPGGTEGPQLPVVQETPCEGDPVRNPEVAAQTNSGIEGGMYGCTRIGSGCSHGPATYTDKQFHSGLDLKNGYDQPVYAMYAGVIYNSYFSDTWGYHTKIQSTVNGQTFITIYAHLQEIGRVTSGTVAAGQIIGYQGDSGNLRGAIADGYTTSHVHIEVREHDGSTKWDFDKNFNEVDPRGYLSTQINSQGAVVQPSNCN